MSAEVADRSVRSDEQGCMYPRKKPEIRSPQVQNREHIGGLIVEKKKTSSSGKDGEKEDGSDDHACNNSSSWPWQAVMGRIQQQDPHRITGAGKSVTDASRRSEEVDVRIESRSTRRRCMRLLVCRALHAAVFPDRTSEHECLRLFGK